MEDASCGRNLLLHDSRFGIERWGEDTTEKFIVIFIAIFAWILSFLAFDSQNWKFEKVPKSSTYSKKYPKKQNKAVIHC
jgi:hypothetical protein